MAKEKKIFGAEAPAETFTASDSDNKTDRDAGAGPGAAREGGSGR